jgi:cell division septum initiation protein DivIVA
VKEAIKGYITALINTYEKRTAIGLPLVERQCNAGFVNELNDLLDFVEDMLEFNNRDNELLRKRVKELEETCSSFTEIEENLHKQISRLKRSNQLLLTAGKLLGAVNNELKKKIKDLEGKNEQRNNLKKP